MISAVALGLALTAGCKKGGREATGPGGLGLQGASGQDSIDDTVPVEGERAELVARRGLLLGWEEYILAVGLNRGLSRVGGNANAAALPLASVDPGFNSGQVTVYRWLRSDVGDAGELEASRARKWLVVPLLLRPDQVLENEQFDVKIPEGSVPARQLEAVIVATRTLADQYPGGRWNPHAFVEVAPQPRGPQRRQTRVYMMASAAGFPDVELLVEDRRKKRPAQLLETVVHHEDGLEGWSRVALERPGAMTVARAVAERDPNRRFEVTTVDGARWSIDPNTGEQHRLN